MLKILQSLLSLRKGVRELKTEYWDLMKEKQVIDNTRRTREFEEKTRMFNKQLSQAKDTIESLNKAILMTKEELAEEEKKIGDDKNE